MILTEEVLDFIYQNRETDIYHLALNKDKYPFFTNLNISAAVQARQKLSKKLPRWVAHPHVFIPDPIMVEQASSEELARYKAFILPDNLKVLIDLSGGLGSDTIAFAEKVPEVHYLELDPLRVKVATHNFQKLGVHNITLHEGRAEELGLQLVSTLQPDLVYLDPDRRITGSSQRKFRIEDAAPNLLEMVPRIQELSPYTAILAKLSPMVDVSYLETLFADTTFDLYVVSLEQEAKELLLYFTPQKKIGSYYAVELFTNGKRHQLSALKGVETALIPIQAKVGKYLYDPLPAISKLGVDKWSPLFDIWKPAKHTHLYFSDTFHSDFPARAYEVIESGPWDRHYIKYLVESGPLHLVAKNFHTKTDALRTQLKIKEGGSKFLFAYTNAHNTTQFLLACPYKE